jgi:hypothetical protein
MSVMQITLWPVSIADSRILTQTGAPLNADWGAVDSQAPAATPLKKGRPRAVRKSLSASS